MNNTELKAYNWLITQGYKESEIIKQKKSPDFIINNSIGYEIKLVYGKTICFHTKQFNFLKSQPNIIVLVFNKKSDIPISSIPTIDLEDGKIFGGFKIKLITSKTSIELPASLINRVKEFNKSHENRPINVSGVCRIALEKELKDNE